MLDRFFGKTKKVKCPDGREVYVIRNIDEAMPLHLRNHSTKASARGKITDLADADSSVEYGTSVSQILFAINDRNASQAFDFRSAYLVYMSDPCRNSEFLARVQNKIMEDRVRLEELQMKSHTLIALAKSHGLDSAEVKELSMELTESLKLPSPKAAAMAIEEAKADARDMLGDSGDV